MPLTNQQYDALEKEYDAVRRDNQALLLRRQQELFRQFPEIRELDASVSTLSAEAIRAMLEGDSSLKEQLPGKLLTIRRRKAAILTSAGYPENYLDPIYTCPACRDTGYTEDENHVKIKCSCLRNREIRILYDQSHIREKLETENFQTLSDRYYQGEDLKRFQIARKGSKDFVQNFKQDYRNLLFYGTVGTGKSFLSGCIASELLQSVHSVIYFSASGLFDTLARYTFDARAKEALSGFYEDLYNCDLLIIDDLGTEMTNTFVASQLFSCLNERHLRKNSTIISTNLSLEELRDRYSDRVFSRITSHYDLCKLTGPDIRMYKKRMQNISDN